MDSEHELEFDDELELQTPRKLRIGRTSNSLSTNGAEPSSQGIVEQSTVLKMPLKGDAGARLQAETPSRLSPSTYARINKYQSRNGTPLKKPPIGSSVQESLDEDDEKQIRETKLLTDDNKLDTAASSPLRTAVVDMQQSSPVKSYKIIEKAQLGTPPKYNIRSRPVNESSTERKNDTTKQKLPIPSPTIRERRPSLRTESLPAPKPSARRSLPLLRSDRSSFLKHDLQLPDMSRAEILERMNESILSLIENDTHSRRKSREEESHDVDNIPDNSDESSGDSPEKILDEIDMVLNSTRQPSSDVGHRPRKREGLPGLDEESGCINSSPGKRRKKTTPIYKNISEPEHTDRRSKVVPSSIRSGEVAYYGDWPEQRWSKLDQLIRLNLMSKEEIIDSGHVLREFNCVNKNELKQRVDFLTEYSKLKTKKTRILPRKGKLRSKRSVV